MSLLLGSYAGLIVTDVSAVFIKFLSHFGWAFLVTGAVFGEFGA